MFPDSLPLDIPRCVGRRGEVGSDHGPGDLRTDGFEGCTPGSKRSGPDAVVETYHAVVCVVHVLWVLDDVFRAGDEEEDVGGVGW